MTLLPASPLGVRGHPGNAYDVDPSCAHPHCGQSAIHVHHVWPRSFLRGQPKEWVNLDGTIVGNRVGLCLRHHNEVTGEVGGYKAMIRWLDGLYWWAEKDSIAPADLEGGYIEDAATVWTPTEPLAHQPPGANAHGHDNLKTGETCPTCGHTKRSASDREEPRPGKLRQAKEWTISVPDDAEIGADVLDEMISDLAIPLGMDEYSSRLRRYHVLAVVLAWASQNRSLLIEDVAAAAERRVAS